jgi:16S rRNA (adenine1518-N6/adenine1519-N6)-dimethyltransferase
MKITELKSLLIELGIHPSKLRGQNFLIDNNILQKIVLKSGIEKDDHILEVGPGFGALTEKLIDRSKKVLAVEFDRKLYEFLENKYKDSTNLTLLHKDILKVQASEIEKVLGKKYKVIANLPYSITSSFLRKFLEAKNKPTELVLMIQKEVGERMLAKVPQMNILALSVQLFAQPKILFTVSEGSFFPEPRVKSVVIQLKINSSINLSEKDQKKFFEIVKLGFSSKRKKLISNLGKKFDKEVLKRVFGELGLGENVRAQEVGLEIWVELVKFL